MEREKPIMEKQQIMQGVKTQGYHGGPDAGNHPYKKDGTWSDEDLTHPTPTKTEPYKATAYEQTHLNLGIDLGLGEPPPQSLA